MSILIKGREMPTSCLNCPCRAFDGFKMESYCNILPTIKVSTKGRPTGCPLREVPPHGRLIDVDALMETFSAIKETSHMSTYQIWTMLLEAPTVLGMMHN